MPLLEVCVDESAGLAAAVAGGADRIELCSALGIGGLTPSQGFMREAAQCGVKCRAMIRPRGGDFIFDRREISVMCADIAAAREVGLEGVVIGAATDKKTLDLPTLQKLIAAAGAMELTLHRVVDTLHDPVAAVADAARLGFDTILSSGGAPTALDGHATLRRMHQSAGAGLTIMAGSGVDVASVPVLAAQGLRAFHASCSAALAAQEEDPLGFAAGRGKQTDAEMVRALKSAIGKACAL